MGNNDIFKSLEEKNEDVKGSINEQYWRNNIKQTHGYFSMLVNETADFLTGKPVTYSTENENLKESFDKYTSRLDKDLYKTAIMARNFNKVFWQVFINEEGNFDYMILDTRTTIPIYQHNGELSAFIKYYYVVDEGKDKLKIEYWTKEGYTEYIENSGSFEMLGSYENNIELVQGEYIDKRQVNSHLDVTKDGEKIQGYNWSQLPFIEFSSNDFNKFDIDNVKTHIDNLDILMTDGLIDMKTFKEIYGAVFGFDSQFSGSDDSERDQAVRDFFSTFRKYGLMFNRSEEGKAEFKTVEIPTEARQYFSSYLEDNIYKFGQSPKKNINQNISNLTGVALKVLQDPLVKKVSYMNLSFIEALNKYVEFLKEYEKIQHNKIIDGEIEFKFNYNFLTNDFETIQGLATSMMMLSKRTILENHPYVVDVDQELQRIEEETDKSLEFAEENKLDSLQE